MRQLLLRPVAIASVFLTGLTAVVSLSLLFPQRWLIEVLSLGICPGAVYFKETEEKVIALTIDDSPDRESTSQILEVLNKYQVKATFFPISDRVLTHPELTQSIVAAGHELGNHLTKDEPSITLRSHFESELQRADTILSRYDSVNWLRPGYGWCNKSMVQTAQAYNYQVALGSIWSYDTHLLSDKFASQFILINAKPGSIVVLHDGGKRGINTAKTLETVIPQLQQQGYRFVTLSELQPKQNSLNLHTY